MDIRIDRCVLHGPQGDVRRAQRVLMSCPWPPVSDAEVVILRRVQVQARPDRLPARLYQATDGLIGRRVDGWSETAADADCVYFCSEVEMLARLSLDLATGRAAGLWFWQSFRRYLVATPPQALAELWLDQAPRLSALIPVLRERRLRPRVWTRLPQSVAPALLERILGSARATELRGAIAGVKAPSAGAISAEMSFPAVYPSPQVPADLIAALAAFGDRPGVPHRGPGDKGLLALVLAVAADRPHWIAAANAAQRLVSLRGAVEALAPAPPRAMPPPAATRPTPRQVPGHRQTTAGPVSDAESGAPPVGEDGVPGTPDAGGQPANGAADAIGTRHVAPLAPAATEALVEVSGLAGGGDGDAIPAETGDVWHIEQGGLFYLLNLLNWRPVRERLFADPQAMAFPSGWGWLYRIGELLGLVREPPLIDCLTRLSGMPDGHLPADLPELAAAEIAALGAERFAPFGVWHPRVLRIPALVVYRRPELDVHFALSDLEIGVRRAGLDVDPGWIDWLGAIVRFHYR